MKPPGVSSRILRQFAGAWLVVFGALAWRRIAQGDAATGAVHAAVAAVVGLPGLVHPQAVRIVYLACLALAAPVGRVVSEALTAGLFYGVLLPVALVFKVIRRDTLHRRAAREQGTYWTPKVMPEDVRRYLRQF